MRILQCVPNFSEGRSPSFVRELKAVLMQFPVKLLDVSMNRDHNRADATFLGAPEAVEAGAMALAGRALELIDMRTHKGSHPRMGAVDVVPFVPLRGMTMAEAVEIARRFGQTVVEIVEGVARDQPPGVASLAGIRARVRPEVPATAGCVREDPVGRVVGDLAVGIGERRVKAPPAVLAMGVRGVHASEVVPDLLGEDPGPGIDVVGGKGADAVVSVQAGEAAPIG